MPSRKYVLDPSVTSNTYGVLARNMMPSQPINNFQSNTYSNSTFTSNQDSLNPMPMPMSMPNSTPLILTNNANLNPLVPNFNTNAVAPLNPVNQVNSPPPYTNSNQGLSAPPSVEQAQFALNSFTSNAAAGWNDPPVLNKPPKIQVS